MRKKKRLVITIFLIIGFVSLVSIYQFWIYASRVPKGKFLSRGPLFELGEGVYLIDEPVEIRDLSLEDFNHLGSWFDNKTVFTRNQVQKEVLYDTHKIFSVQVSPSKNRLALFYYPDDSFDNLEIIIFDTSQDTYKEMYHSNLQAWRIGGNLNWLGNDHVFFTVYCGTSCEGLILLNVLTGKTHSTTIAYMPSSDEEKQYTVFPSWFGKKEFKFDGFINEMSGEMKNDQAYLIFRTVDNKGNSLGEKQFLFTNNFLTAVN